MIHAKPNAFIVHVYFDSAHVRNRLRLDKHLKIRLDTICLLLLVENYLCEFIVV